MKLRFVSEADYMRYFNEHFRFLMRPKGRGRSSQRDQFDRMAEWCETFVGPVHHSRVFETHRECEAGGMFSYGFLNFAFRSEADAVAFRLMFDADPIDADSPNQ